MNKLEREEYLAKIKKFVDSGKEVEGRICFETMDAISATYSMAQVILDINERIEKLDNKELDYFARTKKFAER